MDFGTKNFLFGFLNSLSAFLKRSPRADYNLRDDAGSQPLLRKADRRAKPVDANFAGREGVLALVLSKFVKQAQNVELLTKMLGAISLRDGVNAAVVEARSLHSADDLQNVVSQLKPKSLLFMDERALSLASNDFFVRGKLFSMFGVPSMFTFDTTLLLLEPAKKKRAWQDLQSFRDTLRQISPEYEAAAS